MLHAVIMAGGSGSRFWPQSRESRPKQLLKLLGERSMIQATVDRIGPLVPPERLLVATTSPLAAAISEQLPKLPLAAILAEPCQRDTAPCIGLAAMLIQKRDPQATMAVLPADHVIEPAEEFVRSIRFAADLVELRPDAIVTFGIKPTYPAESFGYIERGAALPKADANDPPAYQAIRFREKPNAATAQQYLAVGNFLWNAGIFVWKAKTIVDALSQHQPKMHAHLATIAGSFSKPDYPKVLAAEFAAIERISIDYAVMEHAHDVIVVEPSFRWDDVGSWQALARLVGTNAEGHTVVGQHLDLRSRGLIVHNSQPEHVIVTLGLDDCLVVHTPDATLVANKHDEEAIRELVKLLRERGWERWL